LADQEARKDALGAKLEETVTRQTSASPATQERRRVELHAAFADAPAGVLNAKLRAVFRRVLPDHRDGRVLCLMPPNYWHKTEDHQERNTETFLSFICNCNFYSRLIDQFCDFNLSNELTIADEERFGRSDIFSQPILYPPPATHPLFPLSKAPNTQPPPHSSG
jgi:hypothetical protein